MLYYVITKSDVNLFLPEFCSENFKYEVIFSK